MSASGRGSDWRAAVGLAIFMAVILFFTTKDECTLAGNETSRLAGVQSLVDEGTFSIERSIFMTIDRVKVGVRFYSDKPVVPIVWLGAVYWVVRHLSSVDFHGSYHLALHLVTFLGIGSFSVALSVMFFLRLRPVKAPMLWKLAASAAVVLATIIFSYGNTINNHTPAACLFFGMFWALDRARGSPGIGWSLASGVLAGAVFNFDFPTGGLGFVGGGVLLGWAPAFRLRSLGAYTAGFGLMILLMLGLNHAAYGTILPAYLIPGAQDFEGNIHSQLYAGQRRPLSLPVYLWDVSLGNRGLFSYMPVLLFAIPALISAAKKDRRTVTVVSGTLAAVFLYYATQTGDYAGWSYGFRYLIPLIPILFWYSFLWLMDHRSRLAVSVYAAAIAVGLTTSVIGAYNPWPVIYEGVSTKPASPQQKVRNPVLANLLAWSFERHPDSSLTSTLVNDVYGPQLSRDYLEVAYFNMQRHDLVRRVRDRFDQPKSSIKGGDGS